MSVPQWRPGLQTYRSHTQLQQKWRETDTCPAPEIKLTHEWTLPVLRWSFRTPYIDKCFMYFKNSKENYRTLPQKPLPHLSEIFWLLVMTATWYQHPGVLFCQEESLFHLTKKRSMSKCTDTCHNICQPWPCATFIIFFFYVSICSIFHLTLLDRKHLYYELNVLSIIQRCSNIS